MLFRSLILSLFNLLIRLLKNIPPVLIGAIVLLFTVHPLHTEVVASVKSRDELLAGLFLLLSWFYFLKYLDESKRGALHRSLALFALASFTKESAIAFVAILPLSAVMFRNSNIKDAIKNVLPFAAVSIFYLTIQIGRAHV